MHDGLILTVAVIGCLGVGAQWLAWRFKAPAIVLMLAAGAFVGPIWSFFAGAPLIDPNAQFGELLRPMVALAVAVILFEGGLNLRFSDLAQAGAAVRRLVIVGAPLAWGLGTLAAHYAAGLSWPVAALFAGIMVVTGPTVIMPLLRQSRLGGRVAAALKWEGIVNDPLGALFAVFAFEALRVSMSGGSALATVGWLIIAAFIGAVLGIAAGFALARLFRSGSVAEYLKAPSLFVIVLLVYALSEQIAEETGLIAVTAFGITLANHRLASLAEVRRFKENIATLLISGVFVVLTASLTPQTIASVLNLQTLAFLILMLFVVRPVSVFVSTLGTLKLNEAALIGWIAPRGVVAVAVSGLFADKLISMGVADGERLVALAFAVSAITVVAHGFTIGPWSRRLGLARTGRPAVLIVGAGPWSVRFAETLKTLKLDVVLADSNWRRLQAAREAGIETYFGDILTEEAELKVDFGRFDSLAAVSPNDSFNALVCQSFAHGLGRDRVFQISMGEGETSKQDDAMPPGTRGVILGAPPRSYDLVTRDIYRGWRFRATELSDAFTLDTFRKIHPEASLIGELRPDGSFNLIGRSRLPKGGPGASLVSFGPDPVEAEKPAVQAEAPMA